MAQLCPSLSLFADVDCCKHYRPLSVNDVYRTISDTTLDSHFIYSLFTGLFTDTFIPSLALQDFA